MAKTLGGSLDDYAGGIQQTTDNGYIMSGVSASSDGDLNINKGGDDFWILKLQTDVTLPLHFISFTATFSGKGILLQWKTENEIDNAYFKIEKSSDGLNFVGIGSVSANEGRNTAEYTFTDYSINNSVNFYRIKQVDKNGMFTYSHIINIKNKKELVLRIFPNPSPNGIFKIDVGNVYNSISASVADAKGNIVFEKNFIHTNEFMIQLNKQSGLYFLKIECDGLLKLGRLLIE